MIIKVIIDRSRLFSRLNSSNQYNIVKCKIMHRGIKNMISTFKTGGYKRPKSSFRIWLNMNSWYDLVSQIHLKLQVCMHKTL